VEALAEYGVTLKILGSVRAADQWEASGDFRRRLLAAFSEHGIEIPRPQRVVLAQDPGGTIEPTLAPDQDDLAEGTD
jgi:small-conductance mechanosensitive channel